MSIKKFIMKGCLGAVISLAFVGGAHAAATFCSVAGSPNTDGLKFSSTLSDSNNSNEASS